MRGKPLETVRTEEGCIVSTSHKLNSGTELAEVFEVSVSSACKWIREWKCRDYP